MKKEILFGLSMFLIATSTTASATNGDIVKVEEDVITVFDKARPDYDPIGMRAGSFIISPSLEVQEKYDDNIYARETNEEEDFITVVKPAVEVDSNWSKHRLTLTLEAEMGFYADFNDENYEDYLAALEGRFDIMRETYIKSALLYARRHEERGYPESPNSAVEPIEFDEYYGSLGVVHEPGKMSFEVTTYFRDVDYHDGMTSIPLVLDQDIRDRMEYGAYGRVGYEFMPNYEAFIEVGLDMREYDQTASSGKDSEGYYVVGGTEVNISGKSKGRLYAGYMSREYDDSATYEDIDGLKVGGELLWNINEMTSLTAELSRSIEETLLVNYSGYTLTSGALSLEHELKRNILLAARTGWDNYDYTGNLIPEREDDIMFAGVEAKYLINRNFSAGVGYQYQDRNSNIIGEDYSKNVFMLSGKAAF